MIETATNRRIILIATAVCALLFTAGCSSGGAPRTVDSGQKPAAGVPSAGTTSSDAQGLVCKAVSKAEVKSDTGWEVIGTDYGADKGDAAYCKYYLKDDPAPFSYVIVKGRVHGGANLPFNAKATPQEGLDDILSTCPDDQGVVPGSCGGSIATVSGRPSLNVWVSRNDGTKRLIVYVDGKDLSAVAMVVASPTGGHKFNPKDSIAALSKLAVAALGSIDTAALLTEVNG